MSRRPRHTNGQAGPVITDQPASICPACGSTARTDYHHTNTHHYSGVTADGRPYNRIVYRYTNCRHCGQARIDRTYELDAPPPPDAAGQVIPEGPAGSAR
jgi:hypothetical protein